jgi:FlaA1/EpsC-like NDP-sugar epimerase
MSTSKALFKIRPLARRLVRHTVWSVRAVHLAIFLIAGVSAFLLRFDFGIPQRHRQELIVALCAWTLLKVPVFYLLGLDRGWWRFTSVPDLLRVAAGNVIASTLACLLLLLVAPAGFPRSLYVLDFVLCFVMTAGVRIAYRVISEFFRGQNGGATKRTLIYGAGDAGVTLLREIRQNPALAYEIVGFVDDSSNKRIGTTIQRAKVFGNGCALPSIVRDNNIEMVLIALPSATGAQMTAILKSCHEAGVAYRTVPGLAEVIESSGLASQIRDVAVEDLLGRNSVHIDESGIRAKIQNKVVAVTGAAGSIGSELCRQIARFGPAAIVAYDCAETALFYIDREMREQFPDVSFHAEIGDIRNPERLAEVFGQYRPSILYHAAAYKHVPMMEAHPFEAVENNVIGTWNVAVAAAEHGISDFVMISSDKAVRPTNIMGATKRIAELLIKALESGGTNYVSVRFGNVLGSNGSVIPLFKQQIAARKPLTITHPEMRRYFMTIPEAAQLVLQASTMGKDGDIFVLDMGEPVRIVDLARNLILLSGLRPDEDIKIEFTGMRPGEKLYEELAHTGEEVRPTYHDKIMIFANNHRDDSLLGRIKLLRHHCAARDLPALIIQFKDLVPDYNPSIQVLGRVVQPVAPVSKPRPLRAVVTMGSSRQYPELQITLHK